MKSKSPPSVFGASLRRIREEQGFTLQEVAESCGMSWTAVRRIETQTVANTQLVTIQKLAGALGVTVAELVKDVPAIEPEKK